MSWRVHCLLHFGAVVWSHISPFQNPISRQTQPNFGSHRGRNRLCHQGPVRSLASLKNSKSVANKPGLVESDGESSALQEQRLRRRVGDYTIARTFTKRLHELFKTAFQRDDPVPVKNGSGFFVAFHMFKKGINSKGFYLLH